MNKLIQKEFNFQVVKIKKLVAYDNTNYLIHTKKEKYIFKIYKHENELLDLITAENEILLSIIDKHKYPQVIQFKDSSYIKIINIKGEKKICRMLSFLDGVFLGNTKATKKLYQSLGSFLAEMDIKLKTLTNYTIKARQWEWDIQYLDLNKKYIKDISDIRDKNIVKYFFQQFEEIIRPELSNLRKQIIHNDANEWNVLTKNGVVSGIIDFGDIAFSPLINELAVAITYACYDKENPLEWALIIIKSYHAKLPLEENEIKILYYLIASRLVISVCNSAHARKVKPENTYANTSEKPAWKMLYKWLSINPVKAENIFRKAIGLSTKKPNTIKEVIKKEKSI